LGSERLNIKAVRQIHSSEVSSERDINLATPGFLECFHHGILKIDSMMKKMVHVIVLMGFSSFSPKQCWFLLKEWEKP